VNLIKRWAILALAFWLTTFIVSGIQIQAGAWNYFWVAALFGVINTILGGLLKLFTLPQHNSWRATETVYPSCGYSYFWSIYLRH